MEVVQHQGDAREPKQQAAIADSPPQKTKLMLFLISCTIIHQSQAQDSLFSSLQSLCDDILYSEACLHNFSPLLDSKNSYDLQIIYNISVQMSKNEVFRVLQDFSQNDGKDIILLSPHETCRDFLTMALDNLNMSVPTDNSVALARTRTNFRTWLRATIADLQTCLVAFERTQDAIRKRIAANLERSTQLVSTSLGIITKIDVYMNFLKIHLLEYI